MTQSSKLGLTALLGALFLASSVVRAQDAKDKSPTLPLGRFRAPIDAFDIGALLPEVPSILLFGELRGATSDRNPFGLLTRQADDEEERRRLEQEVALANALEWVVGARWHAVGGLYVEAGLGSGIVAGFGSPDLRVFAGVRFAPKQRDKDGDGIFDDEDACPEDAEDEDGFEDADGCPDLDNDADGLPDATDRCPEERGPIDNQGCPIRDGDKDGVADEADTCPDAPGPADRNGCPIVDSDEDGLFDELDACPNAPGPKERQGCPLDDKVGDGIEDKIDACPTEPGPPMLKGCPDQYGDGVADHEDKCPADPGMRMFEGCGDKDQDGVGDHVDKCPDERETINGVDDDDGCPDQGKVVVIVKKDKIEILETVYFQSGRARLQRRSHGLLDQVAQVIKANPQIKKIRIEGHTDDRGNDAFNKRLSQARAEAVGDYLVNKGVDPERLEAVGYGEERPVASNRTADGRAKNRRVEFVILEQ